LAIHVETIGLVGIDGPRDELIHLMDEEGGVPAHELKVFSIVGFGGLGKTTLANEIYRKLKGQFHCQAFVSVSQKPNIRKILRTILSEVGFRAHEDTNIETWDKSEFISELKTFLLDKRYASGYNLCGHYEKSIYFSLKPFLFSLVIFCT
jgi:translation initiation factor RLI1